MSYSKQCVSVTLSCLTIIYMTKCQFSVAMSADARMSIVLDIYQWRRQDFAKGGADARCEMPTPLRSGLGAIGGSGGH